MGCKKLRYDKIRQFVENITIFCPNIKALNLTVYVAEVYQKIIEGNFNDIKRPFTLIIPGMMFYLKPKHLPYVKIGDIPNLVHKKLLLYNDELPEKINYYEEIINLFDWTMVESLVDGTSIGFLKKYHPNSKRVYRSLRSLSYHLE